MNLFDYLSISSLSLDFQKHAGCFENVIPVSGLLRKFLQQSVVGGRCMISNNEKKETTMCLQDFDAVSLYPSAQARVYYPAGEAHTMTQEMIDYYNKPENLNKITEDGSPSDQNTLFVEVYVRCPKVKREFPLLSVVQDGIRIFQNDIPEIQYLSHIALQDVVRFQGYEYNIISGIYFTKRNYKINEVITQQFLLRKKFKEEGNPLQTILKLMLNSSYGKTIEGDHNTQTHIVRENDFNDFIKNNFNHIDSITELSGKYAISVLRETSNQKTYPHVGSLILAMSKRIMNEVMCLAENMNIKIFYQDTDSMHVQSEKLNELNEAFQLKYNRNLIGKNLGQFHSDFESEFGVVEGTTHSIFLGKKAYIDELRVKTPSGEYTVDYHVRLKGISQECVEQVSEECGLIELYTKLFNGEEIEFDLCNGGTCMEKQKNMRFMNLMNFKRVLSFK